MSMKSNNSQRIEQRKTQWDQYYENRWNQHQTQPSKPSNLRVECSNTKSSNNSNGKKQNTQNKAYEVRKRRPIPFLDDFEKKWINNGVRNALHGTFGKETVEREDEQSQKVWGKTEKDFKNCPHYAKHAFFVAEVSRQIVARLTRQNT